VIRSFRQEYASRDGTPVISHVDLSIFVKHYFALCLDCNFCHDACCFHGTDVALDNLKRLEEYADGLEAYTGIPRNEWFTGDLHEDIEYAGGAYRRTRVRGGACSFLNRSGRGCLIHRFCREQDLDYHDLKPVTCWLFPVTFNAGLLQAAAEIQDGSLICSNTGPTLYEAARSELSYYFGEALISELDEIGASVSDQAAMG